MSRESQREVLADRQNPEQPALFDGENLPAEPGVLLAIQRRSYEHTGVRLLEDDTKALRLVELLMLRWGVKRISKDMNISSHTVRAARRELTKQGKLAPYIQRVTETIEDLLEAGATAVRDAIESGKMPASQISVPFAIFFDKRQLMLGAPTSISERLQTADLPSVEALNAYLEKLPSAASKDSESLVNTAKPPQTGIKENTVATLEATQPRPTEASGSDGQPGGGGGAAGATVP